MKGKMDKEKRDALIEEGKALKDELAGLEQELGALETTMQIEGQKIPNDTHPDVPIGGEEVAALRREVGAKRDFRCVPYTGSHTTASAW
jgi:seryl-tRNA synthetase